MVKTIISVVVITMLLGFFSNATGNDTPSPAEIGRMVAARSAARGLINEMRTWDIPGLIEETKDSILDNTKKHTRVDKSEKAARKLHDAKFNAILEKKLKNLYKKINITLSERDFVNLVMKKNKERIAANKKVFLNTNGRRVFLKGRSLAVKMQQDRIAMNSYPDRKVVEDLYKMGWKSNLVNEKKKLLKVKKSRIALKAGEVLLQEVESKLNDKLDEIFAHSKIQIKAQFNEVESKPSKRLITFEQFSEFWTEKVRGRIEKMDKRKKPGEHVYMELFSSVNSRIKNTAGTEELNRFKSFIKVTSIKVADSDAIVGIINENLPRHKIYDKSRDLIAGRYMKDAGEKFVDKYVNLVSDAEREKFKERLTQQHLSIVENDISLRVKKLVEHDLRKARRMIADKQLKTYFSSLADRSLALTEENEKIIKRIYLGPNLSVDSFRALMMQPMKKTIVSGHAETNKLLDETEGKAVASVGFIVAEAKRAWEGQHNIYLANEGYIWDAAAKRKVDLYQKVKKKIAVKGQLTKLDKDILVKEFTEKINRVWGKNRIQIIWPQKKPVYKNTKYVELFQHIKIKIEQALNIDIGKAIKKVNTIKVAAEAKIAAEAKVAAEAKIAAAKEKADGLRSVDDQDLQKDQMPIVTDNMVANNEAKVLDNIKSDAVASERASSSVSEEDAKGINWLGWLLIALFIIVLAVVIAAMVMRKRRVLRDIQEKKKGQGLGVGAGLGARGVILKYAWWVWPLITLLVVLFLAALIDSIVLRRNGYIRPESTSLFSRDGDYLVYKLGAYEIVVEPEDEKYPAPKTISIRKAE